MALSIAALIPNLLMVRNAEVDTLSLIYSPVSGMKNFFVCKFGLNLRFVLRFENETLLPTIDVLPVKSQIFDIMLFLILTGCKYILFCFPKNKILAVIHIALLIPFYSTVAHAFGL